MWENLVKQNKNHNIFCSLKHAWTCLEITFKSCLKAHFSFIYYVLQHKTHVYLPEDSKQLPTRPQPFRIYNWPWYNLLLFTALQNWFWTIAQSPGLFFKSCTYRLVNTNLERRWERDVKGQVNSSEGKRAEWKGFGKVWEEIGRGEKCRRKTEKLSD